MGKPTVAFKGDGDEGLALTEAVNRNCECKHDSAGFTVGTLCGPHAMLFDQRVLDHLLWGRHVRSAWPAATTTLGQLPVVAARRQS